MYFCDPIYEKNLTSAMLPQWADLFSGLLSICRSAVEQDRWILASFFFYSENRGEFRLGPHWGIKAPFISKPYDSWMVGTEDKATALDGFLQLPSEPGLASRLEYSKKRSYSTIDQWLGIPADGLAYYGITSAENNDSSSTVDPRLAGGFTCLQNYVKKLIVNHPDQAPPLL